MNNRLLASILFLFCVLPLLAQDELPARVIGPANIVDYVGNPTDSTYREINFVIGQTVSSQNIPAGDRQYTIGFPFNVLYLDDIFTEELNCSKGYFADYVLIKWDIANYGSQITSFKIFRQKMDETDSILVANISADNRNWQDNYCDAGVLYKYTVLADGIYEHPIKYKNFIQDIGFRTPVGTITGRVTYEGGTAVKGVSILAESDLQGGRSSLSFDGIDDYIQVPHKHLMSPTDVFTYQSWIRFEEIKSSFIFQKGDLYSLRYDQPSNSFIFTVGTSQVSASPDSLDTGYFMHVSAVYTGDSAHLYYNGEKAASAEVALPPAPTIHPLYLGSDSTGSLNFKGYLDEIRFWNEALTEDLIDRDYTRVISGREENLIAYYRLDEGISNFIFDLSRESYNFNENHGDIFGASWSTTTPELTQLAFKGITDKNGNYIITGLPYETDGSTYTFTPMFQVHTFEPSQALLFMGTGASIHNNIDFLDKSSFLVRGNVKYRDTKFAVEGIFVYIDGTQVVRNGLPVMTNINGDFEVSVPIGFHYMHVGKHGHFFHNRGRFPYPDSLYDFQEPITGLEFIDTTLIKVAGKVVGGKREADKLLGFGLSKNNIGHAEIRIKPQKEQFDLVTGSDLNYSPGETYIDGSYTLKQKEVVIHPDIETGEYVAYLLPEKFTITSITAGVGEGKYTFDPSFHTTLDLTKSTWEKTSKTDTTGITVADGDTSYTIQTDTFKFQTRKDFILRLKPVIEVKDKSNKTEIFGESSFTYSDENLGISDDIELIDADGDYTFGYPVFNQRKRYQMVVNVFEKYVNSNSGIEDHVPLTDGKVEIVNNLAINTSKATFELNNMGQVIYVFPAGLPEINQDPINPGESYTKTLSITAFIGSDGSLKTTWREGDPFRGYIFGGMPTGNNFVSTGPTQIINILRDPPGSESAAFYEAGESYTYSTTRSVTNIEAGEYSLAILFGATIKTFAGIGAGIITETEFDHNVEIGFSHEEKWVDNSTTVDKTTTTQRWSTSASPDYVGAMGDVFIGYSTNIVYGKSLFLELIPESECTDCPGNNYSGYKIGMKTGLRMNPEFATAFQYTQNHIEEYLMPNLISIKNSFLKVGNPDDFHPLNEPVYISRLEEDDINFGSNNTDENIWGDQATLITGDGPSYKVIVPASWPADTAVHDTVYYFNQQIKEWEFWLAENEKVKIEADPEQNISFDAGTAFEKSVESTRTTGTEHEFEWTINPSLGLELGFTFNKFGLKTNLKESYTHTESDVTGEEYETVHTYGYTLADGDQGDYISVDVKKPGDGFGPVFRLKGGQTSCPYQGQVVTKYHEPGQIIDEATMRIEVPAIDVVEPVMTDVPENQAAIFTLQLKNNSETEDDNWYELIVDDVTNPDGAVLKIDGGSINNGRVFKVPAGEILTKTLTLQKSKPDVMDYEDIGLIFRSICQGDPTDDMEDIMDEVYISAFFQPICSDLNVVSPLDKWLVNTNTGDTMMVMVRGYDRAHSGFRSVLMQYKPTASSSWVTDMIFFNDEDQYNSAQDPRMLIDGPSILYDFNMNALADRTYDIRAKAMCYSSTDVLLAETPTLALSGIKDTKRPKVFGTPQPADGVLSPNDEIMVQFDEPLEEGLLNPYNFSVKGVLNGYTRNHNVSVHFDGIGNYAFVNEGVNLEGKSFTIEFWLQKLEDGACVLFSQGSRDPDLLEIGFSADNKLSLKAGGKSFQTINNLQDENWHHWAVVYNSDMEKVFIYMDSEYWLEENAAIDYAGSGRINIGNTLDLNGDWLNGNLYDLRVWEKALGLGDVYAKMYQALSGTEFGLIGYWPMDEAIGDMTRDMAHFRHATLFAGWQVLPKGTGFSFDGNNQYLELNATYVILTAEMDYTIECWFKAGDEARESCLLSSGKGTGDEQFSNPFNALAISFDANGYIKVFSNGQILSATSESYLDDTWHHFALVMSRRGNIKAFVDGNLQNQLESTGFGGLAGTKLWLGARGFKSSQTTTSTDMYFNGVVDELRIWKTARTLAQIKLDMNCKVSGDEKGLTAYYPFDAYQEDMGIMILRPSLDDQYIPAYGSNGGTASPAGGADYSEETPNIKDIRPVQKVAFEYVVNVDKIIITPKEPSALIEKCILEITIEDAQDKNANRLASPVTWTAFIDMNQVKWSETGKTFEKELYDPFAFTSEVVNLGGRQQQFTIENLPPWLTAKPDEGSIAPLERQTITFTVNEALNIGQYVQDLYLRSDFGFNERLLLDLRVYQPEPAWAVNPANFEFSMNIIGQLSVDGVISTDQYDLVGVFKGNECRGAGYLNYVEAYDMYEVFLDIYGNADEMNTNYTLRVWNASEGVVHDLVGVKIVDNTVYSLAFNPGIFYGTPQEPVMITAESTYQQMIPLTKGWNWVSFNLASPLLANTNTLFSLLEPSPGDQIKTIDKYDNYSSIGQWIGSLTIGGGIKNERMYMVKISNSDTLYYAGSGISPSENPITIIRGWNWIGYIPRLSMPLNDALSRIDATEGDLIKSQRSFSMYDEQIGWLGSLSFLAPGNGYMYFSTGTDAVELRYPEKSLFKSAVTISSDETLLEQFKVHPEEFEYTMSVIARIDLPEKVSVGNRDKLIMFSGENNRAVATPIQGGNGKLFFLNCYGNEPFENLSFRLFSESSSGPVEFEQSITFKPDLITGTIRFPFMLTMKEDDSPADEFTELTLTGQPNPFSDNLNINYYLPSDTYIELSVYDVMGRKITILESGNRKQGLYTIDWNGKNAEGNDLAGGLYIMKLSANNRSITRIIEFNK